MTKISIQVLIVDDEENLRKPLADWLTQEYEYDVETAASGSEALELLAAKGCFDVALLDYLLPAPYNGLSLMEEIRERCPGSSTGFIIFTGWGLDPQVGSEALKAGAYRYLAKPFDREELGILIQHIAERRRTEAEKGRSLLDVLQEIDNLIVNTRSVDEILQHIVRDAIKLTDRTPSAIYLIGENGTSVTKSFQYPPDFKHPKPRMDKEDGLARQVIVTGDVVVIPDIREDTRVNSALHNHARSVIAVPLKLEQRVVGIFYAYGRYRDYMIYADVSLLLNLTSRAEAVIRKSKLSEQPDDTESAR